MQFRLWLENSTYPSTYPIESIIRRLNASIKVYSEKFLESHGYDYFDPDDLWRAQSFMTFYYHSEKEGFVAGEGNTTHYEVGKKYDPELERDEFDKYCIAGRYGAITLDELDSPTDLEYSIKIPLLAFWPSNDVASFNKCIYELGKRTLIPKDVPVYMGKYLGTFSELLESSRPLKNTTKTIIPLGNDNIELEKIPELLHRLPKNSELYKKLVSFICSNKNNPEYSSVIPHVIHRVKCYQEKPNFVNYDMLRKIIDQARSQKEIDTTFDLAAAKRAG